MNDLCEVFNRYYVLGQCRRMWQNARGTSAGILVAEDSYARMFQATEEEYQKCEEILMGDNSCKQQQASWDWVNEITKGIY